MSDREELQPGAKVRRKDGAWAGGFILSVHGGESSRTAVCSYEVQGQKHTDAFALELLEADPG